jgi:hypothetical protein
MSRRWKPLWRGGDEGQDLMEYAMLTALIVVIAMAGVGAMGSAINSIFWEYIAANFI